MCMHTLSSSSSSSTSQLLPPPSHVHANTRNNAGCPEETSEMLCFWFTTSNGGSGGVGEPMVGQDMGTLWPDLGAEFEHHYWKGECAIHFRCCKSTITPDTRSVYTYYMCPAFGIWAQPAVLINNTHTLTLISFKCKHAHMLRFKLGWKKGGRIKAWSVG